MKNSYLPNAEHPLSQFPVSTDNTILVEKRHAYQYRKLLDDDSVDQDELAVLVANILAEEGFIFDTSVCKFKKLVEASVTEYNRLKGNDDKYKPDFRMLVLLEAFNADMKVADTVLSLHKFIDISWKA